MNKPHPSDADPAVPRAARPTVPGRYRIESALGQGGMGEVWLAFDTVLHRRVALKRMLPEGNDRELLRAMILKEARRASGINDPHVAAIHDVLDLDDGIVLVMEFVDGATLRRHMTQPMVLADFWSLAIQCAEGVAVAHAHGVIHRDIKPENLMVTALGQVKILDFGIARRSSAGSGATTVATDSLFAAAGTPQYMAPEAHLERPVDERTDLFALGVVFYEMLAGRHPFDGTTYAAVLDQVLNREPPPLADLNPAAGGELSRVVARLLAKDPADRFQTSAELVQELRRLQSAAASSDLPQVVTAAKAADGTSATSIDAGRPARVAPRSRGVAIVASVAVALAIAAGTIAWRRIAAAAIPRDRNVAVLPPATGSDDVALFELGAVDLLSDLLQRHTAREHFQTVSFSDAVNEQVKTPADARKMKGANLALVPTFERRADAYRARLALVDTGRERVLASRVVETPSAEPFRFLDGLYRASAAMLREPPLGLNAPARYGIRGAGTMRFYLQGIGHLRASRTVEDATRAVADLEVACRTEPRSAVARAGLANALRSVSVRSSDALALERAERTAREAVALDSLRPEPHSILGEILVLRKQHAAAVEEFRRVAALDPTNDEAQLRFSRMYGRLGQPEREKQILLATIAARPHCWQPYWWLATWEYRQGNIEPAIQAYREMIRRAPDYAEGYAFLGGVLVLSGHYAAAIDTLRRSIALRPTRQAFENLGTAYFNSNQFEQAVDAYNQAFQFGDATYESWLNIGDAYSWLEGRKSDADSAYTQAVRLGREKLAERSRIGRSFDAMIPANLAMVFARIGQPDSARSYLFRAVSADSTSPMVGYCAALTYWQLGERPRAIAWLQQSVHGGYPTAWLRDSPIFTEWRTVPEFRMLAGLSLPFYVGFPTEARES